MTEEGGRRSKKKRKKQGSKSSWRGAAPESGARAVNLTGKGTLQTGRRKCPVGVG